MLYKSQTRRPYAPMAADDVVTVRQAGVRARALEVIIQRALASDRRESARIAQAELKQLKAEIYQKYDIRL